MFMTLGWAHLIIYGFFNCAKISLTHRLPTTTIVAPPCNVRNADDYSCLSFGNADKALSFYLTAQCLNSE
jgi:hypothetical protein